MAGFKVLVLATTAFLTPATVSLAQHHGHPAPQAPPPPPQSRSSQSDATTVEGVVVNGRQTDLRSYIDRQSYSVANDLQSTTGSVADALRNVPSVEVDMEGNPSLRGDRNVTILIDGRPSGMFEGMGSGDALQQIPADQIERIEVMTNPSAAFRPDGSAGIINLVTKANRRAGASGTIRATVGNQGRYNAGVGAAYNAGPLGLTGDASYRKEHLEGDVFSTRETPALGGGGFVESRQTAVSEGEGDIVGLRAAVTYDADATSRLSFDMRYRSIDFAGVSDETYQQDNTAGAVAREYARRADTGFDRANTEIRAGLVESFAGDEHELSANVRLERSTSQQTAMARTEFTLPAASLFFQDTAISTDQDRANFTLAYTRPFGDGGRLRSGFEVERTENQFNNYGANGPTAGSMTVDPSLTNTFLYDQTVQSLYATVERPFGNLTAQAGLRLEGVAIDINQVTGGLTDSNDYFRAYPSLHLGWRLDDAQQLTASYSMRVQRPRPEDLNPYRIFIDPFNYRAGNPRLEPEETQSFELGWSSRAGQRYYLATLYYRETTKSVTDVVQDLGAGVFLTTRENLGESRNAGLELVANANLTPTLSYNLSGSLYWREIDASNLGFNETRSGMAAGGRVSLNWQPAPNDFFQMNALVTGERLQAQGLREPSSMVNFGYRRKLRPDLSLVLTVQDAFESFEDTVVIDTPNLRERTTRRMHAGTAFYLGLTYSLGGQRQQRDPAFEYEVGE